MNEYVLIVLSAIFINNFIVARFLGICPFLGVSKQVETATGMGMAVTFVMALASGITYWLQKVLVKFDIEFLRTITFILVIAVLVQFVEMVIKKSSPVLYQALGIYLPLITTNCAVLGVTILNVDENYNFLQSVVNGRRCPRLFIAADLVCRSGNGWLLHLYQRQWKGFRLP